MLLTLARDAGRRGSAAALARKYHVFGTDKVGQDVLYQALKSMRTGLVIGTLTTLVMLPFALALRHHGRLFRRLGRRRHPVRLHDA